MPAAPPAIRGSLATHPLARPFAEEVHRVHRRYAAEVVAANSLCPFLRDIDTGFGHFCVVLEPPPPAEGGAVAIGAPAKAAIPPELDVALAVDVVRTSSTSVVHIVYPLTRPPTRVFEKFAGRLAEALKIAIPHPPVMATFHPELTGDPVDAYRLVGMLRRAPDPFIQLIPEGLHQGGTVFAGMEPPPASLPALDPARANFERLRGGPLERLFATLAEVHDDRARSYAPYLAAFAAEAVA